ncbi:hypothetical protein [Bradyrhizobium sp. 27S5]|uniref:hypothetical protein n=1 Tax=Bradyrhizobium sp. 27S5 TaxID=3139728 RepID=UPI0030CBBF15
MIEPQKLYDALELISKGLTRPTKIAKAMGISYRSYCQWMVRSNSGDEKFLVEYNDETMQWARAITLATKLALFELRGMVLQEAIYGYDEIQTKDGQVVWAIDPAAAAMSEEDREVFGYRKDALLEIDGKLQPVVIKRKAPFAQQIRLLEAAFPDLRPTQIINQNVNLNGTVGVGLVPKFDYSKGPPAVPPAPLMPELPAPVDADFSEVDDDDLSDLLGPEPKPAPVNINVMPEINVTLPNEDVQPTPEAPRPITDRTIRDIPPKDFIKPATQRPVGYSEVPLRAPRNDLERDLFAKLAAAREKAQT